MNIREGLPRAAAISPRVQVVEHTRSTNIDLVRHVMDDPGDWPHLSVLLTDDQRGGKGRLGRDWVTPAGSALAISVVIRVDLPPAARGWISLIAGAAMTAAVGAQVGSHRVRLKWPNDVLLDGGKVCGILAEVVPGDQSAVVVGSGVNTALQRSQFPVDTAMSFAALGLTADEDVLVADYLSGLSRRLQALIDADGDATAAGVRDDIERECSTVGSEVVVTLPGGQALTGSAEGIDAEGRLVVVDGEGGVHPIAAGDVVHVR